MANEAGLQGASDDAVEVEVRDTLAGIDARVWDRLARGHPLVSHGFLSALHDTGCASVQTGWQPVYLVMMREGQVVAAMPLYLKGHSRGEYVFDYAWADAFERNGLAYYPKLLGAMPFTPVTGPRLLAENEADKHLLARAAIALCQKARVSSLHILFPDADDLKVLRAEGFMVREGIQYHWKNADYASFDAFLAHLTRDKRRKMNQDSRKVENAGVTFTWLTGREIGADDMAFFYQCYANTYRNHYSSPYLNLKCFSRIAQALPEGLVMILAWRAGARVAAALNVRGADTLYGRYWGSTEFIASLHFEVCYTQAIAYCIAHRLKFFEGGAQGAHKMARGLLPTPTYSAHWVTDRRFAKAIADFLEAETEGIERALDELEEHTPFKSESR
jgi:predicted N-acyltransferase